jgi:hypothetical protein
MDIGSLLGNAILPDGALEAIKAQGRADIPLADGVAIYSGHDRGVAFRFFVHQDRNDIASKQSKYGVYRPIEMVEWLKNKDEKPTERLKFLPTDLLEFDDQGECIGGQWAESYRRWKQGLEAPGLLLSRWDQLGDGEVKTLAEMGIYTVEQFATLPRSRVVGRLPEVFVEAFERAIEYLNGKDLRKVADQQAVQLAQVLADNEKMRAEMEAMRQQLSGGDVAAEESDRPRRGRPRKDSED